MRKATRRVISLGLTAMMAVSALSGCSGSGQTQTQESVAPTVSETAAAAGTETVGETAAAGVDRSQRLIIYSNSASSGRQEWLKEQAEKEGFNIEVVSIPGGELTNRLIAEKNNALADMVYGLNTVEYEKLKAENLLMKYQPEWASEVDMSLGDAEGYYYPIVVQPLVLVYNNEMADPPKDWTDLADPKYKDQYNIFGLNGGTAKNVLSGILVRYADPAGELGISEEGWEVVRGYIQNAHIEVPGEDYLGSVISGERPMSMLWGSGVLQNQKEREYTFGVMTPEIGEPYVVEQVAVMSTTPNGDLAIDFANWFGSAEVQAAWSEQFGTIAAHPEALAQAGDDVKGFMAEMHAQDIDWGLVAENIDMWVEKVELEFVQ